MSFENPRQLIRSWNLSQQFNSGPITTDKLVPKKFTRIRSLFCQNWRQEKLPSTADFGNTISYFFPESLNCISAAYVEVDLPALGANYKNFPGLFVIEEMRLLSGGSEVSKVNVKDTLRNYCESLDDRQLKMFGNAYLGREDSQSGAARKVMIPIMCLPNSAYNTRNGSDNSHGVLPLRGTQLEVQITFAQATRASVDPSSHPVGSISNACSILLHEVQMREQDLDNYSQLAGDYSLVTVRRVPITTDFIHYDTPNAEVTYSLNKPIGSIFEVEVLAYADVGAGDADIFDTIDVIEPTSFKVVGDTECVKDLNTKEKIHAELWANGFGARGNATFNSPGRLCFATHSSDADHLYSGSWDQRNTTTVSYTVTFAAACRFKLVAHQYIRVKMNKRGVLQSYLD